MPDAIRFDDRVAIVTGGARGLGAAYAQELARRGAAVVVHDLGGAPDGAGADPGPARELAESINAAGGRAVACTSDAGTTEGGKASVQMAINEFGRLDVVIANAGIIHSYELSAWPAECFDAHIKHHLLAAFHVVKPAFSVMKSAGYGRLVFVSSAAGVFGQPGLLGYAAAKTAMLGLMNVAAIEGAEFGIKANTIMPMGDTRMAKALMGESGESPEARQFLETMRLDQVAPVVAYLASEQCTLTRTALSAFCGRVAALQIGVTTGWVSPTGSLTAEDVAERMPEILDTEAMLVPDSIFDEIGFTASQTAATATGPA